MEFSEDPPSNVQTSLGTTALRPRWQGQAWEMREHQHVSTLVPTDVYPGLWLLIEGGE